jgi:hypothetical protein
MKIKIERKQQATRESNESDEDHHRRRRDCRDLSRIYIHQ